MASPAQHRFERPAGGSVLDDGGAALRPDDRRHEHGRHRCDDDDVWDHPAQPRPESRSAGSTGRRAWTSRGIPGVRRRHGVRRSGPGCFLRLSASAFRPTAPGAGVGFSHVALRSGGHCLQHLRAAGCGVGLVAPGHGDSPGKPGFRRREARAADCAGATPSDLRHLLQLVDSDPGDRSGHLGPDIPAPDETRRLALAGDQCSGVGAEAGAGLCRLSVPSVFDVLSSGGRARAPGSDCGLGLRCCLADQLHHGPARHEYWHRPDRRDVVRYGSCGVASHPVPARDADRRRVTLLGMAATPVVIRLYGAEYTADGIPTLLLLLLASVPRSLVTFAIAESRAHRNIGVIVWLRAQNAVLVLGLSYVLTPSFGVEGIALSWLIAQLVGAVSALRTVFRRKVGSLKGET